MICAANKYAKKLWLQVAEVNMAVPFVGVVIMLLPSVALVPQTASFRGVLVLYWYNKNFPRKDSVGPSFQATFSAAPAGTTEYYSEYLEPNRFPGEDQALVLRNYLQQKYAHHNISVIVATGDWPLDFFLKYRDDLFARIPMVFVAAKSPTAEQLAAGPGATGLRNLSYYRETLDLALRLHPGTRQLFIVSGTVERDKKFETLAREAVQSYESRVSITYLTDLTPNELTLRMKSLPKRSLVLYVWQQAYDEQGK